MFFPFLAYHQDNPSDKDVNQGTLVVFNLDPSVSNDDLRQIFGAYGEVKEVINLIAFSIIYSFLHFPCFMRFFVIYCSCHKSR